MAGTFYRPTIRVKPVATAGRTLHLDHAVRHHPRGHQRSQRTPAPNLFQLPGTGFTPQRPRDRRLAELCANFAIHKLSTKPPTGFGPTKPPRKTALQLNVPHLRR